MQHYLLAIDQGTTNSRAIIFDKLSNVIAQHEMSLKQTYPHDGWVEQNPLEMFDNIVKCCRNVLSQSGISAKSIIGIGISNQRETTIIWDKQTGQPLYPAIVWQDRRTVDICKRLSEKNFENMFYEKTGLLLDPYFSATKLMWLLENINGARERAERGEILFGTVDTFLLWKLTSGLSHATDASNASRTLLFNIHTQKWDEEILKKLNVPIAMLPTVLDNTADFGKMDASILGEAISIAGMAGDQQAAAIGQACFSRGMIKVTYGTGGFMLLNTGENVIQSKNKLLSTIAYRINKKVSYGLEGSFFSAGSTIKWLRDKLKIIHTAAESEEMAKRVNTTEGVYLIPGFTGLGAPYWNPNARGGLIGLTQNTGREHIVRAGLESVAYQTFDLLQAIIHDSQFDISSIRVDGGMTANTWLMQFIADILNRNILRPRCIETTALGAAYLAGLQMGVYQSLDEIAELWQMNADFTPQMPMSESADLYKGWKTAIGRITMLC